MRRNRKSMYEMKEDMGGGYSMGRGLKILASVATFVVTYAATKKVLDVALKKIKPTPTVEILDKDED